MNTPIQMRITDKDDPDFLKLIPLLDAELDDANQADHQKCIPFNKVDALLAVVLIMAGNESVGCGACKKFDGQTIELKRMFVRKEYRKQGHAKRIVMELEKLAREKGFSYTVLETGNFLTAANALYKSLGYQFIPNYGPYKDIPTSVCMRKNLTEST